jgi:plastocyanin
VPGNVTIRAGDAIRFVKPDFVLDTHTVNFNGTRGEFEEEIIQVNGRAAISPTFFFPQPSNTRNVQYDGQGFIGSGFMTGRVEPWTVTFNREGTFPFICSIHDDIGMRGVVIVQGSCT